MHQFPVQRNDRLDVLLVPWRAPTALARSGEMLFDRSHELVAIRNGNEADFRRPHCRIGRDNGYPEVEGFPHRDGISVVDRGAEKEVARMHGKERILVRHIATKEYVRSVGFAGYQFPEIPFDASRTDDHETRLRVPFANEVERVDLDRKAVFRLEESDGEENRLVRVEEALQMLRHVSGREAGRQRVRLNELHLIRSDSKSVEEPHDFRVDSDNAIESSEDEAAE